MNKFLFTALFTLLTLGAEAQDRLYADEFPLGDVTLLDGPLKKARDLTVMWADIISRRWPSTQQQATTSAASVWST